MVSNTSLDRIALVSLLVTSDTKRNFSAMVDAVEKAHSEESETETGQPSFLICELPKKSKVGAGE